VFAGITGCVLLGTMMILFALLFHYNLVLKWKRDRQIFLILIVQIILFVITVIPLMICLFYNAMTLNIKYKLVERLVIERFCFFLAEIIAYLLPKLAFYLYTMTASMFLHGFVNIIRSILRCLRIFVLNQWRILLHIQQHRTLISYRFLFSSNHN
jgi:hypothetical protein